MRVTVFRGALSGEIRAIPSKSDAHRKRICAFLANRDAAFGEAATSLDIEATARCLSALGAGGAVLDCGESGSTLRFMLPLVSALGVSAEIRASESLARRPNAPLIAALSKNGAEIKGDIPPYKMSGRLRSGVFELPGNISSQYVSGLLMALPLLDAPCDIALTGALESARYADMTIDVMARFGVIVYKREYGFHVPAPQTYVMPRTLDIQGDWSNAAFFYAANKMGSRVRVTGLSKRSFQPDSMISDALLKLGGDIDVSEAPDLAPALCVCAAVYGGTTRIVNAARLRLKESDRLSAMANNLRAIGADVSESADSMTIRGGKLLGGAVSGYNDHRVVMAMAIAGTVCERPLIIDGAEAVSKSYPGFFADFKSLGGRFDVE